MRLMSDIRELDDPLPFEEFGVQNSRLLPGGRTAAYLLPSAPSAWELLLFGTPSTSLLPDPKQAITRLLLVLPSWTAVPLYLLLLGSLDANTFTVIAAQLSLFGREGFDFGDSIPQQSAANRPPRSEETLARVISSPDTYRAPAGSGVPESKAVKDDSASSGPFHEMTVWFGTNRAISMNGPNGVEFGHGLDTKLRLGRCVVQVSKDRPMGGFDSAWWRTVLCLKKDDILIGGTSIESPESFWSSLMDAMKREDSKERVAIIFVHGYCNTFLDAVATAAAIGHDAGKGVAATAMFSWPSLGKSGAQKYIRDGELAAASELAFEAFFREFLLKSGATRVHLIAHSMGNRVVLRALERLKASKPREHEAFANVVFAAPDVERQLFLDLLPRTRIADERRTLYASERDLALKVSKYWVHTTERAGLLPPTNVSEALDSINVTDADFSRNGHRGIRECPSMLQDLYFLTIHGMSPKDRGLTPDEVVGGVATWKLPKVRRK